jgi:hypothetical protein
MPLLWLIVTVAAVLMIFMCACSFLPLISLFPSQCFVWAKHCRVVLIFFNYLIIYLIVLFPLTCGDWLSLLFFCGFGWDAFCFALLFVVIIHSSHHRHWRRSLFSSLMEKLSFLCANS